MVIFCLLFREVCQQFGRFNRAFSGFNVEVHSPDEGDTLTTTPCNVNIPMLSLLTENAKEKQSDPQSLRDSILNRPGEEGAERVIPLLFLLQATHWYMYAIIS